MSSLRSWFGNWHKYISMCGPTLNWFVAVRLFSQPWEPYLLCLDKNRTIFCHSNSKCCNNSINRMCSHSSSAGYTTLHWTCPHTSCDLAQTFEYCANVATQALWLFSVCQVSEWEHSDTVVGLTQLPKWTRYNWWVSVSVNMDTLSKWVVCLGQRHLIDRH